MLTNQFNVPKVLKNQLIYLKNKGRLKGKKNQAQLEEILEENQEANSDLLRREEKKKPLNKISSNLKNSDPCKCGHTCDFLCFCTCNCPCGEAKKNIKVPRNINKNDKKESDLKNHKKNEVSKSEFEQGIKDRYEHIHSGIYKLKDGAEPIAGAELLQWDYLHGEVEAYASGGKVHLGAIDPSTWTIYKGPEYGRIIKI